jgi:hypothetical protein
MFVPVGHCDIGEGFTVLTLYLLVGYHRVLLFENRGVIDHSDKLSFQMERLGGHACWTPGRRCIRVNMDSAVGTCERDTGMEFFDSQARP